jgi:hypothetical protein
MAFRTILGQAAVTLGWICFVSQTTDFVAELIYAANTIDEVTPFERRRLLERGMAIVAAQRELLELRGNIVPLQPDFMREMGKLAEIAGRRNGISLLIGSGMLMLADEIRRLRVLCKTAGA